MAKFADYFTANIAPTIRSLYGDEPNEPVLFEYLRQLQEIDDEDQVSLNISVNP